ncbi:hypothetical protein JW962_01925 [Candidatus Dojkabacteria bacterium]|nr:hypothetical protein [Candidatus Dojkabacteria bacterium]
MKKRTIKIGLSLIGIIVLGVSVWWIIKDSKFIQNRENHTAEQTETGIWHTLQDTTWSMDDGWAGTLYIFYKDNDGNPRCIRQVEGSGLYVINSSFVNLEVTDEDSIKIGWKEYRLVNNTKLVSQNNELKLLANEPIVYSRLYKIPMDIVRDPDFNPEEYLDYKLK